MNQREWLAFLDREIDAYAEVVSRALKRSIRAGTAPLGNVITAQGEPEAAVPAEPFVSLDDLVLIEQAWRAEVQATLLPELANYLRAGADHVLEEIAARAPVLPDDIRAPSSEVYLAQAENRLRGVGQTTWIQTRNEVLIGMQAGESIDEIAKRIRETMEATDNRARTIARTEVISASNAGALAQVRELGEIGPVAKTWLATHDRRTRPTHAAANGQIVRIAAEFRVGDAKLDFPGDPNGPADEVINCRCTLTWEFSEDFAETSSFAVEAFHLPGKHNQSSHGHGGGGSDGDAFDGFLLDAGEATGYDSITVDGKPAGREVAGRVRYGNGETQGAWGDMRGPEQKLVDKYVVDKNNSTINMNKKLRNGQKLTAGQQRDVDALTEMSTRAQFTEDTPLFRRATFSDDVLRDYEPGTVVVDRGFMSTTNVPHGAYVGSQSDSSAGNVLMRIDAPAGTPVIPMQGNEYVLPPGSRLQIVSRRIADRTEQVNDEYGSKRTVADTGTVMLRMRLVQE